MPVIKSTLNQPTRWIPTIYIEGAKVDFWPRRIWIDLLEVFQGVRVLGLLPDAPKEALGPKHGGAGEGAGDEGYDGDVPLEGHFKSSLSHSMAGLDPLDPLDRQFSL